VGSLLSGHTFQQVILPCITPSALDDVRSGPRISVEARLLLLAGNSELQFRPIRFVTSSNNIRMNKKPLAYDAYQELAESYAAHIDTKPHNAYYERPAMLSMLPDVQGLRVLDAGCGPGAYAEQLVARGAVVVGCDASDRMLELAQKRLGNTVDLRRLDLTQPLTSFADEEFDLINAPLCLDYIEDWQTLFVEFLRILKPTGYLLFSCGHPAFDADYFETRDYFSVEFVQCIWRGFGINVNMPSYRRSLEKIMMPVINAGFIFDRIHEPLPTQDFKNADPIRYQSLMHRPGFLCVRARKPAKAPASQIVSES